MSVSRFAQALLRAALAIAAPLSAQAVDTVRLAVGATAAPLTQAQLTDLIQIPSAL